MISSHCQSPPPCQLPQKSQGPIDKHLSWGGSLFPTPFSSRMCLLSLLTVLCCLVMGEMGKQEPPTVGLWCMLLGAGSSARPAVETLQCGSSSSCRHGAWWLTCPWGRRSAGKVRNFCYFPHARHLEKPFTHNISFILHTKPWLSTYRCIMRAWILEPACLPLTSCVSSSKWLNLSGFIIPMTEL